MENVIIPKKVKEIGKPLNDKKIRIYISREVHKKVYAFSKKEKNVQSAGVYFGYVINTEGVDNIIILEFLVAEETKTGVDSLSFTKKTWARIDEEKKKYPNIQMVGWMRTSIGKGVGYTEDDIFFHSRIFSKKHSMFQVIDPVEEVETYYVTDGNNLKKVSGFYVFDDDLKKYSEEVLELFVDGGVKVESREEILKPTFGVVDKNADAPDKVADYELSDISETEQKKADVEAVNEKATEETGKKENDKKENDKKESVKNRGGSVVISLFIVSVIVFMILIGVLLIMINGMNDSINKMETQVESLKTNISELYDNDMKIGNYIGIEEETSGEETTKEKTTKDKSEEKTTEKETTKEASE